jgi:hypothetical protein
MQIKILKLYLKNETFSEKGTPKYATPSCRDIQPFDYTPVSNPEEAEQLQITQKQLYQLNINQNK